VLLAMSPTASYAVELRVTVAERLFMDLVVKNITAQELAFENCFHTYLQVSDIHQIAVKGLENSRYFDKLKQHDFLETSSWIRITEEVDRVYQDTVAAVEIEDPGLGRKIRIEKSGSNSTVLWNPWIEKSKNMSDFGDLDYLEMVCVESGNVAKNQVVLAAGESAVLSLILSSEALEN
jgi:glucose-6-phosphate 1-epimerase